MGQCCASNNIDDIKSFHSNVVHTMQKEEVENISDDEIDAYSNAPNDETILKEKSNMDIENS
jgi:hypothetical protein